MAEGLVADNSVVMAWCFSDETCHYADAVLEKLTEAGAVVPSIWPLEVINVLLVAERKNRLRHAESVQFIHLLSQLPIVVEREPAKPMMKAILTLARTTQLSSYDAAYLDLAMRKGLPLATSDQKLAAAAMISGVALVAA